MILLKTSPTSIGRTVPSPVSRGIKRHNSHGSMVWGSMYSVHNFLVMVARALHKLVLDDLNDLQPRILLNPVAIIVIIIIIIIMIIIIIIIIIIVLKNYC